jgi:hypothetical protein
MSNPFDLQEISIRMYRPGLGDCFLLTFKSTGAERRYMLIDCGVLQNTQGQDERLGKIIDDIKQQTSGSETAKGTLLIVVGTHEHVDHLAGFVIHHKRFKSEFRIKEVWLPWTENKQDPKVAEAYSAVRNTPVEALREAIKKYEGKSEAEIPESIKRIKKVLDFVSDGGMDSVRSLGESLQYLNPETDTLKGPTKVITRADLGGVRFHVLGPPEDPQGLRRSDLPRDKNEIYHGVPANQATALTAALIGKKPKGRRADLDIETMFELCLPFDEPRLVPMEEAAKDKFFREHYGFAEEGDSEGPSWRRIEDDWLEAGTELALNLDSHTNNTSLVLAIEVSAGGRVLLFPGDAQHGSWHSWATTPSGADLLKRTVFYKVGHHGSNNATLVLGGLDKMASADLVAMLPVDPVRQPNFHLPDTRLKSRLLELTNGRLMQSCEGQDASEDCPGVEFRLPAAKPAGVSTADWNKFISAITWDESSDRLWVEYKLKV